MAKPAVYLETSVVSYATARMSRDLIVAARQQATREWFELGAMSYDLFASELVVAEASSGDEAAARQRLDLLDGVSLLSITDDVDRLARMLVDSGTVPRTSVEDAVHIAVATVHGIDYLLTWNFKHIARATLRTAIEGICREAGYEPPVICTPEELVTEDVD